MKAFILAAGLGTRLRPFTDSAPKILVPVLDVPMLDRLVAGLSRHGVGQFALNTHHLAEAVQRHIAAAGLPGDPPRLFHEPELLGTGGALAHAAPFWDQPLLLWNGDILADVDVAALWQAHQARGAAATLVVSGRQSSSYLQVDEAGWMCGLHSPRRKDERVLRRPEGALRNRAYHGIAVFAPELLRWFRRAGPFDLIDALLDAIADGARIATHDAGAGLWGTTGSQAELARLEQELAAQPSVLEWFTPESTGRP